MDSHSKSKQSRIKRLVTYTVKILSAFFVGLVASLVGRVFIGYETFGFVFVGLVFAGLFLKFFGRSGLLKVVIFDASFVLLLLLLDMYISIAPTI